MRKLLFFSAFALFFIEKGQAQPSIATFTSVLPKAQNETFQFPNSTHAFQILLEEGDPLSSGGQMPSRHDFTGFVPIGGSSEKGFVSINAEVVPSGDVTVLDVHFDKNQRKWLIDASKKVDFDPVEGTRNNCSGGITPWGTVISCEEKKSTDSKNAAGFNRYGYCIEIDPASKTVKNYAGGLPDGDKIWKMGFCDHENACIRADEPRVLYTGMDNPQGYLFKFVSKKMGDLSDGKLFVFKKMTAATGRWLPLKNDTPSEVNSTLKQCEIAGATTFNGIEDVEVGPDGMIYFAVKAENRVYRFTDLCPLCVDETGKTANFETFVGGQSYQIDCGDRKMNVAWGVGNDNLAFDDEGNLWVLQDGGNNYIWVVGKNHTQAAPNVRLFGIAPAGSEPTGLTFTPDKKFGFMSFQHPSSSNAAHQKDAFGSPRDWNKNVAIVFSRKEWLGGGTQVDTPSLVLEEFLAENEGETIHLSWITESEWRCNHFAIERMTEGKTWETIGVLPGNGTTDSESWYNFTDAAPLLGTNFYRLRQVDFSGKSVVSDVVQAGFFPRKGVVGGRIFPNPASRVLKIELAQPTDEPLEVVVFNALGVKKMERRFENGADDGQLEIEVERLRVGHYFIQVRGEKRVFLNGKFAVSR